MFAYRFIIFSLFLSLPKRFLDVPFFYFNAHTVKYVHPADLEFEKLLTNIKHFNAVGLKNIIEIESK